MDEGILILLILFIIAVVFLFCLLQKFAEWNGWKDGAYHNDKR